MDIFDEPQKVVSLSAQWIKDIAEEYNTDAKKIKIIYAIAFLRCAELTKIKLDYEQLHILARKTTEEFLKVCEKTAIFFR